MDEYLTPTQAGSVLRVSAQRIRQFCKANRLAFVWTPLGRLIFKADVERFQREREHLKEKSNALD